MVLAFWDLARGGWGRRREGHDAADSSRPEDFEWEREESRLFYRSGVDAAQAVPLARQLLFVSCICLGRGAVLEPLTLIRGSRPRGEEVLRSAAERSEDQSQRGIAKSFSSRLPFPKHS